MIGGYTDVAVVVSDAQKAKQWYVQKLSFKVALDKGHAIVVSSNVNGTTLSLHLCGDNFAPIEPRNTVIGFATGDFDKTGSERAVKGVPFSVQLKTEQGHKMAKFLDLDGNEFWLCENRAAKRVMSQ